MRVISAQHQAKRSSSQVIVVSFAARSEYSYTRRRRYRSLKEQLKTRSLHRTNKQGFVVFSSVHHPVVFSKICVCVCCLVVVCVVRSFLDLDHRLALVESCVCSTTTSTCSNASSSPHLLLLLFYLPLGPNQSRC